MDSDQPARSKKLIRQFKRHLHDEGAEDSFSKIAEFLLDKNTKLPRGIDAGVVSGLPDFFTAIDKAYAEYEDRLKFSDRSLGISSAELNSLNEVLENLNASISAMLDSLGQGLVFFDETGICSPVFSKSSMAIFEKSPADLPVMDLLNLDEKSRNDFESWLSILFGKKTALSFDDLKSFAPSEYTNSKGLHVGLDYRPVYLVGGVLSGVLMIATDDTKERDAAARVLTIRDEAKAIQSIARQRNEFWRFLYNLKAFIENAKDGLLSADCQELMRELHTFKGLSQSFALTHMGRLFHDMEDHVMEQNRAVIDPDLFQSLIEEYNKADLIGQELFGEGFMKSGQVRLMEFDVLQKMKDMVLSLPKDMAGAEQLSAFFNDEILSLPASACFSNFKSELLRIAELQGKPEPDIKFLNGDTRMVPNDYQGFFDSLIHLARNIIDHGIEGPSQRRNKGKAEHGSITIDVQKTGAHESPFYTITIFDDGAGFNIPNIRKRLEAQSGENIKNLSDQEILQNIFNADFSTSNKVSTMSGRGVGLSAIRKEVEKIGGNVRAEIDGSAGARFVFMIPVIK